MARIQASKLGLGTISLNLKRELQAFPTTWKSKLNVESMELNPRKSKQPIPASYFKKIQEELELFFLAVNIMPL